MQPLQGSLDFHPRRANVEAMESTSTSLQERSIESMFDELRQLHDVMQSLASDMESGRISSPHEILPTMLMVRSMMERVRTYAAETCRRMKWPIPDYLL